MKRIRIAVLGVLAAVAVAVSAPAFGDGSPINVNTANEAELVVVNGIGRSKAKAIIAHREANGDFATVDDLRDVSGIGDKLLERVRPQVTVGEQASEKQTN